MGRVHVSMPSLIHGVSQLSAAERQPVHALASEDCWPTVEHGDQKRPPLIHVAKVSSTTFGDCYFHGIDRGSGERYLALFRFGATVNNGLVFDTAGAVYVVKKNTGTYIAPDYATACDYIYLTTGSLPSENIRAMSVLDYTFITNRGYAVTMANTTTTAAPTGTAHIFIRQGAFAMKYTVKIKNGTDTTLTINSATLEDISNPSTAANHVALDGFPVWDVERNEPFVATNPTCLSSVRTQDIAENIRQKLQGASTSHGGYLIYGSNVGRVGSFTVTRNGSVLKIVANTGGGLPAACTGVITEFEVTTSQGDQLAFGIQNETGAFTNLPLVFTHDYVVKIKGNSLADEDDFWVKFTSDTAAATLSEGTWSETTKPGITYTWVYTPSSLHPHALVRRTSSNDNIPSAALNPVVGNGGKYFSFEPINLDSRLVGDTVSNPNPTFVSVAGTYQPAGGGGTTAAFPVTRKVQDFAFFRDRLVFCCDESVSCSEQGSYFNFLRTTVRALPDSDPIDVSISSDRVAVIHSLVPFAGRLMLFSAESQTQLLGSPNLTPSSVEASQVSHYQSTSACSPVAYEDGVLFPSVRGGYSGLRSLTQTPNTEDTFTAVDLSIHIPAYIPGTAKLIAVTPDSSIIAMTTTGDADGIYVLKQHREGEQIIQSAWMRFNVGGGTIRGIHFFDTKLYVVTEHTALAVGLTYTAVSAGHQNGLARRSDGSVVAWGRSDFGQGTIPSFGALTATGISSARANVSGTSGHSLAVLSNGTTAVWGYNDPQFDLPSPGGGLMYTKAVGGRSFSLGLKDNGTIVGVGDNSFGQTTIPALPGGVTYTHVSAGLYHAAARRSDGNIVTWGSSGDGLGVVPTLPGGMTYTNVSCGGRHTIALRSDGAVVAWGRNLSGEVTSPPSASASAVTTFGALTATAVEGGENHTLALLSDGTISTWGYSAAGLGTVPPLPGGVTYTAMAGGSTHSLALRSDGQIVGWGENTQGQTSVPPPYGSSATVGLYLGYIDLSPGVSDEGRNYWMTLDRRVSNTSPGVSIVVAAGITTITMPYDLEASALMEVVVTASLGRFIGTVTGLNTFTVGTDLTGLAFVAGKKYTSIHSFHKPEVQVDAQNGKRLVLDSTSAVISLAVRYESTSYFKLIVGTETKTVGADGFPAFVVANAPTEPTSGTVVVGVGGRLDSPFEVSVQNDSPFPHTLVSGEWLLNTNIRSPAQSRGR